MQNYIKNADFTKKDKNGVPRYWTFLSPRPALRPKAAYDPKIQYHDHGSLRISGNGDPCAIGAWTTWIHLPPSSWYKGTVYFTCKDIEDPNLSVLVNLYWGDTRRLAREEYFSQYSIAHGNWIKCEHLFRMPENERGVELQLYLRASSNGMVWFADPQIIPTRAPTPRTVRLATTYFEIPKLSTRQQNLELVAERLEAVGRTHADIVLVPETVTDRNVSPASSPQKNLENDAETEEGPFSRMYREKAKQHRMWVLGWIHEREGNHIFNTVLVINRNGKIAGKYRKTHLHWPEMRSGVSPGSEIPVFTTDFGTIGVMICYDGWFPTLAQHLAMRGADIIFFPSAGYTPYTFKTRCVDTTTYGVSSSFTNPSMIVDTAGEALAELFRDGFVTTTVDLTQRYTHKFYDSTCLTYGLPGACRLLGNTLSRTTEEEILEMLKDPLGPSRARWRS